MFRQIHLLVIALLIAVGCRTARTSRTIDVRTAGASVSSILPDSLARGDSLRLESADKSTVLVVRHDTVINRTVVECRSAPVHVIEQFQSAEPRAPPADPAASLSWWQRLKLWWSEISIVAVAVLLVVIFLQRRP